MTAPATPPEGLGIPLTQNTPGFAVDAIYSKNDGNIYALVNGVEIQLANAGGSVAVPVLVWGAENVGLATDTRILAPGYASGILNTNAVRSFRSPRAGTLRNFTARHNAAVGNGNTIVYTVRVNGVPTAMTVTLATGAVVSGADNVNTAAVAANDLISVQRVIAVGIGASAVEALCACEFL